MNLFLCLRSGWEEAEGRDLLPGHRGSLLWSSPNSNYGDFTTFPYRSSSLRPHFPLLYCSLSFIKLMCQYSAWINMIFTNCRTFPFFLLTLSPHSALFLLSLLNYSPFPDYIFPPCFPSFIVSDFLILTLIFHCRLLPYFIPSFSFFSPFFFPSSHFLSSRLLSLLGRAWRSAWRHTSVCFSLWLWVLRACASGWTWL